MSQNPWVTYEMAQHGILAEAGEINPKLNNQILLTELVLPLSAHGQVSAILAS